MIRPLIAQSPVDHSHPSITPRRAAGVSPLFGGPCMRPTTRNRFDEPAHRPETDATGGPYHERHFAWGKTTRDCPQSVRRVAEDRSKRTRARLPNRSNGSPSLAPFSPATRGRRVGDEGVHKQRHRAQLKPSSKTPGHSNRDQTRYHAYRNTPVACTMTATLGKLPRRLRPSYCAAARASLLSNPNLLGHFLLARQWVNSSCSLKPDMHNDMKRTGHEVGLPSLTSTDELEVLGTTERFLLDRAQVMNDGWRAAWWLEPVHRVHRSYVPYRWAGLRSRSRSLAEYQASCNSQQAGGNMLQESHVRILLNAYHRTAVGPFIDDRTPTRQRVETTLAPLSQAQRGRRDVSTRCRVTCLVEATRRSILVVAER
jgi:hypothetical protein